ncbi:hypothetical protein AC249_AIPGENE14097 [Exaiptasia diaphana]|nr:hypothetical protein AC249_AIPGENE14138 [Exaiptasia diaphana]KXJ21012.1 hypothetical protein AC249_AIPGENE14097 [Exaiptasia diaphana]
MSVRHFYTYLVSDEPARVKFKTSEVVNLRERLIRWGKSYKKACNRSEWEKKNKDKERLISPKVVNEFERSEAARDAIKLLGLLNGAHTIQITQRDYTLVRNFLFAELEIDNGPRAGEVVNMTIQEFEKAEVVDGSYVVEVLMRQSGQSTS